MIRRTGDVALAIWAAALIGAGPGCGADDTPYVEFAEICGEAGPVRVLELAPGEYPRDAPFKFGEHVIHVVAVADPATGRDRVTTWATGPCGEAPRKLAVGIDVVFTSSRWPTALLGCDLAARQMLVLDPEGVVPSHVLFTGLSGCGLHWSALGLVSLEPGTEENPETLELARLLLHPYPADPFTATVPAVPLLDRVRIRSHTGNSTGQSPRVFDEFVLALTDDDELVRVGLGDGAVATVQTGVAAFTADDTGRYLLWQGATPTEDDLNNPAGKVFLHDLAM